MGRYDKNLFSILSDVFAGDVIASDHQAESSCVSIAS